MQEQAEEYLDLGQLAHVAEPLTEPIETADFTTFKTMTPGWYVSERRMITGKQRDDGNFSFQIRFEGGLRSEDGRVHADKYPLQKWISSTPFASKDRDGNLLPGKTSQVAEYLKATGLKPKGLDSTSSSYTGQLLDLVVESQSIPVRVYVSRTDRREKQPDGSYTSLNLKLQDFNTGTKENPIWAEVVTREGKTYRATPKVASFGRVQG